MLMMVVLLLSKLLPLHLVRVDAMAAVDEVVVAACSHVIYLLLPSQQFWVAMDSNLH